MRAADAVRHWKTVQAVDCKPGHLEMRPKQMKKTQSRQKLHLEAQAKTIYRKKTQLINQSTNYQHTSTIQPSDTKATSRVSWHLANHLPWFARTPPWQRGAWKSTRSGYPSWPCAKKSVCHIQAHVTPTVGWLQRLQHVTTFQFWCPKKQMDQKMIRFYGLQAYSLGNLLLLIEELICSKPPLAHQRVPNSFTSTKGFWSVTSTQ